MAIDSGYTIRAISGRNGEDGQDGKNGTNGIGITVQYSVSGTENWHATFTTGDIYMRQSTDGGITWSAAMRIVGEKGEQGDPGSNATQYYIHFVYCDDTTSGTNYSTSDSRKYIGVYTDTTAADAETFNEAKGKEGIVWSKAKGDDGTTPTVSVSKVNGKTTITINGTAAATITDGANGASLVNKGNWAASTAYKVLDCVYVAANKTSYVCKTAHTSGSTFDATKWTVLAAQGEPGEAGDDGTSVTITSKSVKYQAGSSGTTAPTGTWSDTVPSVSAGQYLWTRTEVSYSDGNKTTSYSVGYKGTNGSNGASLVNKGNWAASTAYKVLDCVYVAANKTSYVCKTAHTSGSTFDATKWTVLAAQGEPGEDGDDGTSVTITSESVKYQAGSSGTTAPTGTWADAVPSVAKGQYLWTKTEVTYSDGTSTTSYSVGYAGTNGTNGTSPWTVTCSEPSITLACGAEKTVTSEKSITIKFNAFQGTSRKAATITTSTLPSGVTVTSNTAATTSADGSLVLKIASGANLGGITAAYNTVIITLTVTANGVAYTFSLTLSKQVSGQWQSAGWIDLTASTYNTNTWYPVTGTAMPKNPQKFQVSVRGDGQTNIPWSSHSTGRIGVEFCVEDVGIAWGWLPSNQCTIFSDTFAQTKAVTGCANQSPVSYTQMSNSSTPVIWLRGGAKYYIEATYNVTWTIRAEATTISSQTVTPSANTRPTPRGVFVRGKGISTVAEYYKLSASTTETFDSSTINSWSTSPSSLVPTAAKPYLLNAERITLTDGVNTTYEYKTPHICLTYQADGADGRGVTSITNVYKLTTNTTKPTAPAATDSVWTASATGSTSVWGTVCPTTTTTNKYLWNCERIEFDDGTYTVTPVALMSTHGATGRGVTSIVAYTALSTNSTKPAESAFTTSVKSLSSTNKYLWRYEVTTYTDNSTSGAYADATVIAVWGDKGENAVSVTISSDTVDVMCGAGTGTFLGQQTKTIAVYATKGNTRITSTITVPSESGGVKFTKTDGTDSANGAITLTLINGGNLGGNATKTASRTITVVADSISFTFVIKINKVSNGAYLGRCSAVPGNTNTITVYTHATTLLGSGVSKYALKGDYVSVVAGTDIGKLFQYNGSAWVEDTNTGHSTEAFSDLLMIPDNLPATSSSSLILSRLITNEVLAKRMRSLEVQFREFVASFKESSPAYGDLAISMGKNPKNASDSDLNFIIQSYKTKCTNNKEIWHKNFYSKKNGDITDFNVTGLLNTTFGLETFGDIYAGSSKESLNVTGTGLSLNQYNSAVVCYNGLFYLFQASSSSTLIVATASPSGKDLNFTQVTSVASKGLVHDAIVYKDNVYVATSTGVYRYNVSAKTFTTITTTYKPITLSIVAEMLNISTPGGVLALYNGSSITTKSIVSNCFSEFTDGIFTASENPETTSGMMSWTSSNVYFYDKNYTLIGSKNIVGKSVGTTTISETSTVYSSNGVLITNARLASGGIAVIVSYDGGDTWIKKIDLSILGFKFFVYKSFIILKDESKYAYSTDGGNTWQTVDYGSYSSYRCGNAFLVKGTYFNDIIIPINGTSLGKLSIDRIRSTNLSKNGITDYNFGTNNGYVKYSNGLLIQWFEASQISNYVSNEKKFPVSFSNICTNVFATVLRSTVDENAVWSFQILNLSGTGVKGYLTYCTPNHSGYASENARFIAIGY